MDLLGLIREKIERLPDGAHKQGLLSVFQHIDVAYRHLARGEREGDETAFTDAIYRTNQAFEGSIKEAYRVLAEKDPKNKSTYEIEKYLEQNKVFRERILSQFNMYRTQWRNPSTHDHNLDFDRGEAFLAIISVSAFIKLLVDEIEQHLSYIAVRKDAEENIRPVISRPTREKPLLDQVIEAFKDFSTQYFESPTSTPIESELQLVGALSGYLSVANPKLSVQTGMIFRSPTPNYVDMTISSEGETVIVELKRGQHRAMLERGIEQITRYVAAAEARNGILFLYSSGAKEYVVEDVDTSNPEVRIKIIRPKTS